MDQAKLFHEDIYDALRTAVQSLGGPKTVGPMLWPEKTMDQAKDYLNACLNRERREVLNPEQLLLILREARKANSHAALAYICEDAGYAAPVPTEPIDEMAQLQRDYIQSVETMRQLTERMERAQMRLGRDLKVVDR